MPLSSPASEQPTVAASSFTVFNEQVMNDSTHESRDTYSTSSVSCDGLSIISSDYETASSSTGPSLYSSEEETHPKKGIKHMTAEVILQQCLEHQGYRTPELNEKLFLHHFGFPAITKSIHPYRSCKVLYLSYNGISDLSPLAALVQLDSLFISYNSLLSLESLPSLPVLRLLDVSHNAIGDLRVLAPQENLETLLASHNRVKNVDGISLLFPALTSLDLGYNQIPSIEAVEKALEKKSATLNTLILHGNPAQIAAAASKAHYRKRAITFFSSLRFLDEYPVFPEERRVAEAFAVGGRAGEQQMKQKIKAEEGAQRKEQFQFSLEERAAMRERHQSAGGVVGNTQYFEDNRLADDVYIPC